MRKALIYFACQIVFCFCIKICRTSAGALALVKVLLFIIMLRTGPKNHLTFQTGFQDTYPLSRQIERPHQEYRHLSACDRVFGAVVAAAAASSDALYG